MQHVPIKTVRAQSFVEVATFNCLYHLFPCKRSDIIITRVMSIIVVGVYLHHLLSVDIEVDLIWLLSPVVWSFIDLGEVLGDLIIHLNFCPQTIACHHVRPPFKPLLPQGYSF
jgi:hypothetical protein